MPATESPAALSIVHGIRGRVRLRLPPGARTRGLVDALHELPGIEGCAWSSRTRSLLVRYAPDALTPDEIARSVAQRAQVAAPDPDDSPPAAPADARSPVASAVADAFGDLNQRITRLTHGTLDLGILVPIALTIWAVREVLRGQVAPLAWSSALWYAHGLYRDYNPPPTDR